METSHMQALSSHGFAVTEGIYDAEEIGQILEQLNKPVSATPSFRRSKDLFAIRRVMHEIPALRPLVFNSRLREILHTFFGPSYTLVKSIYFDKPPGSNWFVAYHQDLTLSVKQKVEVPGYGPWTVKENYFAVTAPAQLLESILTLRLHLDDTDATNGALAVVPGSHSQGIFRPTSMDTFAQQEVYCAVPAGGLMLMRPLLWHRSARTTSLKSRRVLHLEFCAAELPAPLEWAESYIPD